MKNLLLFLTILISVSYSNHSFQKNTERTMTGTVVDDLSGEPLIFAMVLTQDTKTGTLTDLDGKFSLLVPDECDSLTVTYTGYASQNVSIKGLDTIVIRMKAGITLNEAVVTGYKFPLIEQDNTTQGRIKTAEEIRNLPVKNINKIAATTAGLSSIDGGNINIHGSRTKSTNYYIDGVRVGPQSSVPNPHIENGPDYHTEDYALIVENKFHSPSDEPLSTFSIDVDAASYSNMRRFLTRGEKPPAHAIRIEEMINYFDYEYPQPTDGLPVAMITEIGSCPWNSMHKLVHIGLQGKKVPFDELPASNLVFLLDVSGSMQSEDKLPLVISSFKLLTEHLRAIDRVAIVVYASSTGLVLPSTNGNKKDIILAALEKLQAGGSTAGADGIRQAYQVARENFITGGNNRVILATDGDFNVGTSSDAELVALIEKERESGVFLTVLGFGTGNYMDNKMQQLADHGNGNHGYVDNLTEARKVFVNEFGGTLFTIAKDVKIQVEFNPDHVAAYRLIGYENRMLESEDFNDDKKDAGEMGSGHTVTALYEIIPVGVSPAFLKSVDQLKYQKIKELDKRGTSDELMTIKFRYKDPEGEESQKIEKSILNAERSVEMTSDNFKWSAAVAMFGMLLRDSEYKSESSYEDVELWASASIGTDAHGYRDEFLRLVKRSRYSLEGSAEK